MTRAGAGRGLAILLTVALGVALDETVSASQGRGGGRDVPAVAPFQGTLAEARVLARERNVPLLVLAVYEDDAWDPQDHHDQVELVEALLSNRKLAEVLQRAIVALGCNRVHPLETIEVGDGDQKRTLRRCPSYHTDSCSMHQRLFEDAYVAWNTDGALVSPHVVLLAPDGEVSMRRADGSSPSGKELRAAVQRAQTDAGHGLTAAEHLSVLALGADARAAAERGRQGVAWRTWESILAITQTTGYAEEARAGSVVALQGLEAARGAAHAEVAAGRPVEGYRQLDELLEQATGTPLEDDLRKELRALETDKAHRDAIRAFKREREAETLLVEIEALFSAGDERRAAAKLRGLLRRYDGTAAAARARERWPDASGSG